MSDKSGIEWTDATWNPVAGCTIVSPGCTNCYAMGVAGRMEAISVAHEASHGGDPGPMERYRGTTELTRHGKAVWTGQVNLVPEVLEAPLRWKRPRRIFVNSMLDLFHEGVPDEWIDKVFAVMALCPQHQFQVLTKRPARMRAYLQALGNQAYLVADAALVPRPMAEEDAWRRELVRQLRQPLPNVWLGVSVEDQARADERIPELLATPAAVRFISAEPLLGPVDIAKFMWPVHPRWPAKFTSPEEAKAHGAEVTYHRQGLVAASRVFIDWVIVGGESGPGARPMHPDWARSLRDQCAAAGVPFFFKQWGEFGVVGRANERWLIDRDGERWPDPLPEGIGRHAKDCLSVVYCVGKKAAGRLLDGLTHDGMPA